MCFVFEHVQNEASFHTGPQGSISSDCCCCCCNCWDCNVCCCWDCLDCIFSCCCSHLNVAASATPSIEGGSLGIGMHAPHGAPLLLVAASLIKTAPCFGLPFGQSVHGSSSRSASQHHSQQLKTETKNCKLGAARFRYRCGGERKGALLPRLHSVLLPSRGLRYSAVQCVTGRSDRHGHCTNKQNAGPMHTG